MAASNESFSKNSLVVNGYNNPAKYLPARQWQVLVVLIISLNLGIFEKSVWSFGSICAQAGFAFLDTLNQTQLLRSHFFFVVVFLDNFATITLVLL